MCAVRAPARTETRGPKSEAAVIIPCHNGSRFLPRALDSVLEQRFAARSIVVVDDASVDDSAGIAERYAARGLPVRCIRLRRNLGPGSARNIALHEVNEPIVGFLDADDFWLPEHLQTLVGLLDAQPDAVLAFGRARVRGPGEDEVGVAFPERQAVDPLPLMLIDNAVPQSAAVSRRDAILAAGGYTPGMRYAEDYDLWLRLGLEGAFIYSGRATCVRQAHDGQASNQALRMARAVWEARHRFWSEALRRDAGIAAELFHAGCCSAYEAQLTEAWRSRNRRLLREVISLAPAVPGGTEAVRSWKRRERWVYPFWRVAATVWDAIPDPVRAPLQRRRQRTALQRVDAHRSLVGSVAAVNGGRDGG